MARSASAGCALEALLGFESFDPLTHGVVWALGLNIILYVWVSRIFRPSIAEQIQAESFFYYETKPLPSHNTSNDINYLHHDVARLKVGDLITLAKRITGEGAATRAFQQFCMQNNVSLNENSNRQRHVVALYRTVPRRHDRRRVRTDPSDHGHGQ